MDAYDTRGKIADLDYKIDKQSSENSALQSEIKKNSSYERIYEKAKKQGMSLENDNVKVVRSNGEAKIKIKNKIGQSYLLVYSDCSFYIGFKISYIMITGHSNGQDLVMKANEKYLVKNAQQPERGKIYDRNGKVLAEDVERYKLVAVIDKKASANSKNLGM